MRGLALLLMVFLIFSDSGESGEYANALLELGMSTAGYAMANSNGALEQGITSVLLNAAGLAHIQGKEMALVYMNIFGLSDYVCAGFNLRARDKIVSAFSFLWLNVSDIPYRPDYFIESSYMLEERRNLIVSRGSRGYGYFNDTEVALYFTLARLFHFNPRIGWTYTRFQLRLPVGLNLKLIYKSLERERAWGLGMDLATRFEVQVNDFFDLPLPVDFTTALALNDLTGTNLTWTTRHQDRIAPHLDLGFGLRFFIIPEKVVLNLTGERDFLYDSRYRYGGELILFRTVAFRGGTYGNRFTMGFGVKTRIRGLNCDLDYAYLPHPLGNIHRVGVKVLL